MRTVVVYRSKTGFTRTYAQWIAEELHCDLKENVNLSLEDILDYDTIIYGGGLYAGNIDGIQLIKKNYDILKEKNIIVWATGSCPGRPEEMNELWNRLFSTEQLKRIKTYYLRGGFDYNKLSKGNKILMSMLKIKLKNDKNPTEDIKGLLHAYEVPEDHRDKKNIEPIVSYVNELTK